MSPFRRRSNYESIEDSLPSPAASFTFSFRSSLRPPQFVVYQHRFVNLALLSLLNFLSDWQCYSIAPIAMLAEAKYDGLNSEVIVSLFLFCNFLSTIAEPAVVRAYGLRGCVALGSLFLAIGSIVKAGFPAAALGGWLSKSNAIVLGTILIGLSQPMYQCTPALLSSQWFPHNERTMATSIALNSNQVSAAHYQEPTGKSRGRSAVRERARKTTCSKQPAQNDRLGMRCLRKNRYRRAPASLSRGAIACSLSLFVHRQPP